MGLDAQVYGTARRIETHTCGLGVDAMDWEAIDKAHDACHEAGHVRVYALNGHRQSLAGCEPIEDGNVGGATVHLAGWWECSDRATDVSSSYPGHNAFRESLSRAALGVPVEAVWQDPDTYRDRPFFELLMFADNEGCIGPVACGHLAEDFESLRETVREELPDSPWEGHRKKYDQWAEAFLRAAHTGLVRFR